VVGFRFEPPLVAVAGTIYMNTSMYLEALGYKGETLKNANQISTKLQSNPYTAYL
jgi:hypothetical protein